MINAEAKLSGVNGISAGHMVHMWMEPKQDMQRQEEGYKVKLVPYIQAKGVADSAVQFVGRLRQSHKDQWPELWEALERQEKGDIGGTPLSTLGSLSHARMAELKGAGVKTLEHLAGLANVSTKRHGATTPQEALRAKAFLEGDSEVDELRRSNRSLEQRLTEMEARLLQVVEAPSATETVIAAKSDAFIDGHPPLEEAAEVEPHLSAERVYEASRDKPKPKPLKRRGRPPGRKPVSKSAA